MDSSTVILVKRDSISYATSSYSSECRILQLLSMQYICKYLFDQLLGKSWVDQHFFLVLSWTYVSKQ